MEYTGLGSFQFADGKCYSGEFKNDLPDGKGTLTFRNQDEYTGQMSHGMMEGHGIYRFYDLSSDSYKGFYEGHFANSQFNGIGKRVFADKSIYCGEWVDNKEHGFGQYFYPNGDRVVGFWQYGCLVKGSLFFNDGSKYVGNFKDMQFSGFGIYILSDGSLHQGEWQNNILIRGIIVSSTGEISNIVKH